MTDEREAHVRPRIGITSGEDAVAEYMEAVAAAGGEPIRLQPSGRIEDDAAAFDGFVFSGGGDVDPQCYGESPHPATDSGEPGRDAYEIGLLQATFRRRVPTLAICRGLQVANVAFGGSLHQHVPDVFGDRVVHRSMVDGRSVRALIAGHDVAVVADSRLASIVGPALVTGSRHHQAVERIADALRVVARTPDALIEALEPRDASWFWIGVQWHPESTLGFDDGRSSALFRALIAAARDHRSPGARGPAPA